MASPTLELNFFVVQFPEPFRFLTRPMTADEKLRPDERRWSSGGGADEGARVVFTGMVPATESSYLEDSHAVADAPPGAVQALMSAALRQRIAALGCLVEESTVGLAAFNPAHADGDLEPLLLMRGVEMRSDYLVDASRKRHFGFFISHRVRRKFARTHADDPLQLKAAVGELVRLQSDAVKGPSQLLGFDLERHTAEVSNDDKRLTVPLDALTVPASHGILVRYGELVGRTQLAREAMSRERQLTFRYNDNGRKNPSWIAKQHDYVATWLIEAAQFGRIDFSWRDMTLSMSIQPLKLQESRR